MDDEACRYRIKCFYQTDVKYQIIEGEIELRVQIWSKPDDKRLKPKDADLW